MSNYIIKYALDKSTDKLVFIDDATNGLACNCKCAAIDCGIAMSAIQGKENEWHFRHSEETTCKGGPETIIHKLAKQIIYDNSQILIPRETLFYSDVRLEEKKELFIPDAVIKSKDEDVFIEIFVTNEKKETHIDFYRNNKLKSFEINLSSIPYDISLTRLEELVLKDVSNKKIIFWPSLARPWYENPYTIVGIFLAVGYGIYRFCKWLKR